MLDVRPAAHFRVVANGVRGYVLALWNVGETLELVLLPGEHLRALFARNDLLDESLIERDEPRYLGLDPGEVLGRDAVWKIEVVVKPLFRRGADIDLHVIEHVHDGARHQMRRRMPSFLLCDFSHFTPFGNCAKSHSADSWRPDGPFSGGT